MAAVLIGFCGGLRGEEILLKSLTVILEFLEETRIQPNMGHVMATLQGKLKVKLGISGTCYC